MRIFILGLIATGVVPFLGTAVVIMKNHMNNRAEFAQLEVDGVVADAYVTSRERNTNRRISLSGRRMFTSEYFVTYRYDANSGSRGTISFNAALNGEDQTLDLTSDFLDFKLPVSKAQYDQAGEGHRQAVIFLPNQPEVVRLVREDGTYNRGSGVVWAILMVVLSGLSGLMFWQYKTTGKTW